LFVVETRNEDAKQSHAIHISNSNYWTSLLETVQKLTATWAQATRRQI